MPCIPEGSIQAHQHQRCRQAQAYIVNAAELFGNTGHTCPLYTSSFVRMLLTKATAIPLAERRIMAGMAVGFLAYPSDIAQWTPLAST